MSRPRFTLILSDVHLCPAIRTPGTARVFGCTPDAALASLFDIAILAAQGGRLEVVCNGDLFDFDAPVGPAGDVAFLPRPTSRHGDGAAQRMDTILADHLGFVTALRRVLDAGHRVVFVPGNHDAQLVFPEVRDVLRRRLGAGDLVFRTWFHRTQDGLHIEHGHQYDPLCALGSMLPTGADARLEETIGSIAAYYAPVLPNCPSPRSVDPLDIDLRGILQAAYEEAGRDAISLRRHVGVAAQMLHALAQVCSARPRATSSKFYARTAEETGLAQAALQAHGRLFARDASPEQLLEDQAWRSYGDDVDARLREAMGVIAGIYATTRGVVTGHTHRPFGAWREGVFYGNSGSWTPDAMGRTVGTFVWAHATARQLEVQTRTWSARGM